MNNENNDFYKTTNTVGPIDRIFRGFIGLLILVTAYSINATIYDFAIMHIVTIYLWVTGLTGWDPFYAVSKSAWNSVKETRSINGRFKI